MLAEAQQLARAEPAIGRDLRCERCGYNLRGLTPPGRCPECGLDLGQTLAAERARSRDADAAAEVRRCRDLPPTASEARQAFHGCLLLLLAGLPVLLYATASPAWHHRFSTGRRALLYDLCVGWVLAAYGTFKLTRGDRRLRGGRWGDPDGNELALCSICYALIPVMVSAGPAYRGCGGHPLYLCAAATSLVGLFVPVLIPLRLSRLARRVGRTDLAREALSLAFLTPVIWVFSFSSGTGGRSGFGSLAVLAALPQFPFGSPYLYRELLRSQSAPWVDALGLLAVVTAAWNASLIVRLLLAHVPYLRERS